MNLPGWTRCGRLRPDGRCRRSRGDGLLKVGYGEVGIEETRWLPRGHTVGNEQLVTLRHPTRVAVLPVGYQNGFGVGRARDAGLWATLRRWRSAKKQTVRINGQKARIIGASAPSRPSWT